MSEERQELPSFGVDDFGIVATDKIAATDLRGFLESNPDDITLLEEEEEETSKKSAKKPEPKPPVQKPIRKEEEEPKDPKLEDKKPTSEDLLKLLTEGEEEETDEPKEDVPSDTPEKKEPGSIFPDLAEELFDMGIFVKTDEDPEDLKISTPEEFAARFDLEKKRQAIEEINGFLSRFGDDYIDMFNAVFASGVHPREYLDKYTAIEDIENFDISEELAQERLVRELLKEEGRSPDSITARIEKLKNYGDLKEEAEEAKAILSTRRKEELEEQIQNKNQQVLVERKRKAEYVNNVNTILVSKLKDKEFDGIPINENSARQTFQYLTQDKYQTPTGEKLTEFDKDMLELKRPENHQLKVKVALLMQLLKTDPTLSSIQKKAISNKSSALFSRISKQKPEEGSKTASKKEDKSTSSWF